MSDKSMAIDVAKYREMVRGHGKFAKFEGEPPATAYYWCAIMEGDGKDVTPEAIEGSWELSFRISPDEARAFDLTEGAAFILEGDDQGFVYGRQDLDREAIRLKQNA